MFWILLNYFKLDAFPLASPELGLGCGHLAAKDSCDSRANAILNLVFLHHMREPLPKPLDLEPFRNSFHHSDWVDGRPNLFEETSNEAGFVHAVFEEILPQVRIVLFLGKLNGLVNILQTINDEVKSALHLSGLGV
ncbi:hypothetical protein HG531_006414 [Fusarium graminearum]|nr:hypothetical protein HG531_006414 [Fusarium graminearum]